MTAQVQNLFQQFQQLPDAEQREFVQVIVDQPTAEEEAELDRRELEPKTEMAQAFAEIRANLKLRRSAAL